MTPASERRPLSRDRALREAVALADAEGMAAVSMRNLAARLGVVPMALYKHVANKDDLLSGMVDTLVAGYDDSAQRDAPAHSENPVQHDAPASGVVPRETADWREGVRRRILSARRVLLAHPWARAVIETRTTRTPAVLAYQNALAGQFFAGGFSPDLTHHAMHALGHRIWGFSPEAFEEPGVSQVPDDEEARAQMAAHFAATYPHILAIAAASGGACDADFEFEFTLDLLLDAFERLRVAGWQSPRDT